MERRGDDRPDDVTLGSSWLGLDGGQLAEMIRRQLMDLGATITRDRGSDGLPSGRDGRIALVTGAVSIRLPL
jgi:hypothetical protein